MFRDKEQPRGSKHRNSLIQKVEAKAYADPVSIPAEAEQRFDLDRDSAKFSRFLVKLKFPFIVFLLSSFLDAHIVY
jgi:hypothetical protein